MSKPIFFGCLNDKGHYFYESERGYGNLPIPEGFPWGYEVDGKLQPHPGWNQGHARLHHKDGWTALAWWDMTVDKRPASCSALLVNEIHTFEEMVQLLKTTYPSVFQRQTKELYE